MSSNPGDASRKVEIIPGSGCCSWRGISVRRGMGVTVDILDEIMQKRTVILEIVTKHHATDVRLIGSVARGEADPDSDVDLVVRFLPGATSLDHAAMVGELERLLERKVDVISEAALWESTRARLPHEAVTLQGG